MSAGRAWAAVLAVAALYLASHAAFEHRAFWITDNANKFLQLRAILDGHGDHSFRWPGQELDPDFELNPLPEPFSRVVDGRLYSQYPPAFAAASAPLFRAFSFPGLYVLPTLFAVLLLAGLIGVAREIGLGPGGAALGVLLAGTCTPLWFYALVFWEHSIAACFSVFAVHALLVTLRTGLARGAAICGAALAAAISFREEMLLFAALLLALMAICAPARRRRLAAVLGVSLAAGLVPLLVFQWKTVGAAFGHHVPSNLAGLEGHLSSRPEVFYRLFCASGESVATSVALSLPFLAALLARPALSPRANRLTFSIAALYAAGVTIFVLAPFWTSPAPIAHLLLSNSLLPAAPVVVLGTDLFFGGPKNKSVPNLLPRIVLGYALLYGLAAPPISAQGIHWGNRFLLVLYPLLAVLAARNGMAWIRDPRARRPLLLLPVALVIGVSLFAQLHSLRLLRMKTDFSFRLNQALAQRTEPVVVSDVWWAPQEMFSVFGEKPMFYVKDDRQLEQLTARLAASGHDRILFVTRPRAAPAPTLRVTDELRFFSLDLVTVPLTGAPRAGDR